MNKILEQTIVDKKWVEENILKTSGIILYGTLCSEFDDTDPNEFWSTFRRIAEEYLHADQRTLVYHQKIDELLSSLIARDVRYGYPAPFCHKGCANCCHEIVYCTDEEAALIKRHCEENNISIDYDKLARQQKFIEFDADGNHTGVSHWNDQPEADQSCVFLDPKEKICKVWQHRPFVCRVHLAEGTNKYCRPCNGVENPQSCGITYPEWSYLLSVIFTIHSSSINKTMVGQLKSNKG
ncbi:YkgJ family cysteine cluster protein [Shewanella youngdeokensis]|uniref:YkgJ family cysteine cluster protein n=1 Tax=Shewanella youngdeokensis TaxID=2999068 RepID=A0ABZ0JTE8_9GAMM|nr:YkgJ family cysteine cluster protein [Shewanella sp. DAU334]